MIKYRMSHNTKNLDKLTKSLDNLSDVELVAGILEGAGLHPEAGVGYADLLTMHELSDGSKYPKRPALFITTQNEGVKWGEQANKEIGDLLAKKQKPVTIKQNQFMKALRPLANEMALDVKAVIGTMKLAPNKPSTVARKGFNKPLVESGALQKAIKADTRKR